MKINEMLHGFRLLKMQAVKEVDSTAYEFVHEKSGARLFFLQNKDDNKVFSVTFRTPPTDDTGVPHIVEHSTLCGSRKFPLKEPFVELVKGSLNTFLNAMTFPDKTMYPVASRNDKDFQNLMDVYLDAVFYPAMYDTPEVLMQEGWHYEIEKPEDPLQYSGVVYNEMKGALSSPEDLLETRTLQALYPDTTYHAESGGNPEKIPELTQENFIGFHKKYYHPANSYIFLYGDMDIDAKLKFLDEEYLSHFTRIPVESAIQKQPLFSGLRRVVSEYPVGAEDSTAEKTFLSLNMIVGDAEDTLTVMGLYILEHALLRTEAAPLRQALIDAGIGKDISSSFEPSLRQPYLSIVAQNAEPDRVDRFYEVIRTTLTKLVKEGIDRTLLQASINFMEFRLREADFRQYPKGLIYNINIMNSWLYDADPAIHLYYEEDLRKIKQGLAEGYFERLVERCILQNPHQVLLTLKPSTTMAAEREAATAAKLAAKKAAMTPAEIGHIIELTAKLKERQQSEDSPEALAKIPLLKLSDIKKEMDQPPLEERELAGAKVLFSDVVTNGIAYLSLLFDATAVPQSKLPYAYLLTELIGAVDTAKHSYAELANLVNLHTGGISYDLRAFSRSGEPDSCLPKFQVKAKALTKKLPELCQILTEILTTSSFADKKRVRELIEQTRATLELNLLRASNQIMASRLVSYLSPAGAYNEAGSLEFYWFVKDLSEHFDERYEEMKTILTALLPLLFNQHGLLIGLTAAGADYAAFAEPGTGLVESLSDKTYPAAAYHWDIAAGNEGLVSSSRVQYVGKGANFLRQGYRFTGTMRVVETLMRYDYLWTRVRVQGGAYGASAQFDRNGTMLFTSYRDPNLAETLAVFDGIAEYLRHFDASEREMTKYIIGTMSGIDMPLTPQMKGNVAAVGWIRGISQADRQKLRDEVLATRQQDIRALADLVADGMAQDTFCVFGNEVKLQENQSIFKRLKNVMG